MNSPHHAIIAPEDLNHRLARRDDSPPWVIVDCRFNLMQPEQGQTEYHAGHLPGAFYAHLDIDLASSITADSGRHPLPNRAIFRQLVGSWGVTPATQVVVYDQGSGAIAARLWWLLRWIGHQSVSVLDGGFKAWAAVGGAVEAEMPSACRAAALAGRDEEHAPWISTQDLMKVLPQVQLVDARDARRFQGQVEPIDRVAGHVPGAMNRPFSSNLDATGRFLDRGRLKQQFDSLLGTKKATDPDSRVVHMCGSGVTACHNILAMEWAGLPESILYVGSWSEWIRDDARPIAAGK